MFDADGYPVASIYCRPVVAMLLVAARIKVRCESNLPIWSSGSMLAPSLFATEGF